MKRSLMTAAFAWILSVTPASEVAADEGKVDKRLAALRQLAQVLQRADEAPLAEKAALLRKAAADILRAAADNILVERG